MATNGTNVDVVFRPRGADLVAREAQRLARSGEQMQAKLGSSARQVATGIETIARSGKVAGEGLRQVVTSGAEMAFMFGAAGPIVGAIGILGIAVFDVFSRTRQELERTKKQALETLREIRRETLAANVERAQLLYGGDRDAEDALKRESIPALRAEVAALERQKARAKIGLGAELSEAQTKRLADATAELTERQRLHARTMDQVAEKTAKVVDQHQVLLGIEEDRRAQEEAARAPERARRALDERIRLLIEATGVEETRANALSGLALVESGLTQRIRQTNLSLAEQLRLAGQLKDVRAALLAATPAVPEGPVLRPGDDPLGVDAFRPDAALTQVDLEVVRRQVEDAASSLPSFFDQLSLGLDAVIEKSGTLGDAIQGVADGALGAFGSAIEGAFGAMVSGSESAGSAMETVGRQFLATSARSFGQFFLAQAAASFASTFGVPPNPMGPASGAKYLAAAALMFGVAGVAGVAGAAGGGGRAGGGGGSSFTGAPTERVTRTTIDPTRAATASRLEPRQAIQVNVIGPNDPIAQRAIQELVRNAARRGDVS